jgi:small subunit ribosomal protein S20
MATHASAEKRNRQNIKRRAKNDIARQALRAKVKSTRLLISNLSKSTANSDSTSIKQSLLETEKMLAKAARKGLINKKAASRKISRLAKKALVKETAIK